MWYEMLPCIGIITVAIASPQAVSFYLQKWWQNGNPYKRSINIPFDRELCRRDIHLTGSTYKQQGLDAIPDE